MNGCPYCQSELDARAARLAAAEARAEQAERRVARIQSVVGAQAEDDGLWFVAATAAEAYLQQELRRLHRAIEEE